MRLSMARRSDFAAVTPGAPARCRLFTPQLVVDNGNEDGMIARNDGWKASIQLACRSSMAESNRVLKQGGHLCVLRAEPHSVTRRLFL